MPLPRVAIRLAMIPQSFIQELLGRLDIVDVVDRHVKLKRAGSNYVACCPFHSEKTPSFTVSPTKQFYHCFGCGAHGTAVSFLMEYSGFGFVDAVKDLAQSVGLAVPEVRSEAAQRRAGAGEDLYGILLKAAHYYRARLKDAPHAIAYLKRRGLSGEVAKHFGIGYAPDGWQNLADVFPDYGAKALGVAGLVKTSDEGKRYDVFRDRIIFPIVDVRGNVIAFGGRVLAEGESGPKYLNSPETPVFEKGRELYGLYQARRAIRDAGRVVVVEGYMDVVALAQHEVGYAVATLGTSTTPVHVQKLLRQAEEIVFCFDGDAAGRRAAWRALENSLSQLVDGKQVKFLFLSETEDPDTFVRKAGKAAFEAALDRAMPLSQFLLDELAAQTDLGTHEGRAKLLQAAKPLVKQVAAPMLSLLLRKELARVSGITQQELDGQYQIQPRPAQPAPPRPPVRRAKASLARELVERLIFDPSLAQFADRAALAGMADQVGVDVDPAELRAIERLLEVLASEPHIANLAEYFRGTDYEALIREAELSSLRLQELNLTPADLQREFADGWAGLLARVRKDVERRASAGQFPISTQSITASVVK
ncbi:MAG: DNA primase [Betaproteobacteria bacterium]|nr:DNA primase [Betaproteobacteria bacterium]